MFRPRLCSIQNPPPAEDFFPTLTRTYACLTLDCGYFDKENCRNEPPMTVAGDREPQAGRELARIVHFRDEVFAIVITLLILTIRAPDIPDASAAQQRPSRLLALTPKFLSYIISFLVVATYWMARHSVFEPIRGYDRTLLWLNFLFLMTITFLPFPTSLLGEYAEQQLTVVIYAANVSVASLLLASISLYGTIGRRLTDPDLNERTQRHHLIQGLAVPVVFLFSIVISFFSVKAAMYSWLLLLIADPLL